MTDQSPPTVPSPPGAQPDLADGLEVDGPDGLGGRRRLDEALLRLGDDERGDEAARARARERWLRQQAAESATFAGVLVDLAERGDRVVLATLAGRRHRGWLRSVAVDFCVLQAESGEQVVVRHGALASVRPEPGRPLAAGDRRVVSSRTLADHLASLGDHHPRVLVTTIAADESVGGVLQSVGRDVLVVALDGDARGLAYVPVTSVAEVSLPVSG